jgi:hypothetical protein
VSWQIFVHHKFPSLGYSVLTAHMANTSPVWICLRPHCWVQQHEAWSSPGSLLGLLHPHGMLSPRHLHGLLPHLHRHSLKWHLLVRVLSSPAPRSISAPSNFYEPFSWRSSFFLRHPHGRSYSTFYLFPLFSYSHWTISLDRQGFLPVGLLACHVRFMPCTQYVSIHD